MLTSALLAATLAATAPTAPPPPAAGARARLAILPPVTHDPGLPPGAGPKLEELLREALGPEAALSGPEVDAAARGAPPGPPPDPAALRTLEASRTAYFDVSLEKALALAGQAEKGLRQRLTDLRREELALLLE